MVSDEKNTTISTKAEDQCHDQRIVMLSRRSNGQVPLEGVRVSRLSKADRIRGVTKSLAVDALAVLDEMWEDCQESPKLREKYYQLHHCLNYLKRFCDGKV